MARGRRTKELELTSRLAIARRTRQLSREELARAASVTPEYIYQIETGRSRPGMKTALRLCAVLGISLDFLVTDPVFTARRGRGGQTDVDAASGV